MKRACLIFLTGLIVLGVSLRLFEITKNEFYFYDEGFYLSYNYPGLKLIDGNLSGPSEDLPQMVRAFLRISMMSGKALWFILADSRVFWGGLHDWYFPRVISALAGILTFFVLYRFAGRYYDSRWTGLLSAAFLAVLPGHVFYSRVAIQETLSALFFLLGFYFYIFPRQFSWKVFVSAFFFGAAYFTNYRLIILPLLAAVCELYQSWALRRPPDFRKYLWNTLGFFVIVIGIGSLDDGRNLTTVLKWLIHQQDLAKGSFDPVNFLSYPYYLFRMENAVLALLFFANVVWVFRADRAKALPLVIAVCLMAGFSLPTEKGARYMVVVYPFIVMSAAYLFEFFLKDRPEVWARRLAAGVLILMTAAMVYKSYRIVRINSDYKEAAEFLLAKDPGVKFLSTQPHVQGLYTQTFRNAAAPPFDFEKLAVRHKEGYRYLVIDPQAFVTWTPDRKRFLPKLDGYMGYVWRVVAPVKVYDHFDPLMLERFVFEHNENLRRSIAFLRLAEEEGFGKLRIYDLSYIVKDALRSLEQSGKYRHFRLKIHD